MLNKLVSVVLFIHCIVLLGLGNGKNTVSVKGIYNKELMCLTFVTLLYMMTVLCNKTLTSVGGVPTSLLFGLSFICAGVKLLTANKMTGVDSILKEEKTGVQVVGGIASIVAILVGVVLTLSCRK